MFNEEVFKFDIDNIKNDLAIEGMEITNADVSTKFGDMIEDETNIEYDIINKAVSSILIEIIKNQSL